MSSRNIADEYFGFFAQQEPAVFADYANATLWTSRATTALVHVGLQVFPGEVTARGHSSRNPWSRSEYMTLDVVIVDPNTWGSPQFTAEHENSSSRSRVQYDAWKLLSVESRCRVLVAYFGHGTEFADFAALSAAVREVCTDHPGKEVMVIGGQAHALPQNGIEFQKIHESELLGASQR